MSKTRNWKALSIPAIDGKTTELNVSGEAQSGIVALKLTKRAAKIPANVFALDLAGIGGGEFTNVNYQEDITGYEPLDIVLVYNEENDIEAAIVVEEVKSF